MSNSTAFPTPPVAIHHGRDPRHQWSRPKPPTTCRLQRSGLSILPRRRPHTHPIPLDLTTVAEKARGSLVLGVRSGATGPCLLSPSARETPISTSHATVRGVDAMARIVRDDATNGWAPSASVKKRCCRARVVEAESGPQPGPAWRWSEEQKCAPRWG